MSKWSHYHFVHRDSLTGPGAAPQAFLALGLGPFDCASVLLDSADVFLLQINHCKGN